MVHDPFDPVAPDSEEQKKWPAVPLAYGFVQQSYQLVATRFEAADARLTSVMTLASSLTLGAPVFGNLVRPGIHFDSPWFVAAIIVFVSAMVIGIVGRVRGGLTFLDPATLYDEWLHKSEWQFQKDAVYYAGEHFQRNAAEVRKKSNASLTVAALLALEILLLLRWLTR